MSQHAPRLAEHVRTRGPLTPDAAARLLLPVAEALAALHRDGAVHGAVSPAAIGVDDAGVATLHGPDQVAVERIFTAPEVAAGARADARADVWSFAGVLHHVSTGHSPYARPSGPRDGGWLRPITELALLPDPRDRPGMTDVVAYLRARVAPAAEPTATPTPPGGSGERRTSSVGMALAGAAVIALLGVVGAGLLLGGTGQDEVADRARPAPTSSAPRTEPAPRSSRRATAAPERATVAELERFARAYVRTASTDPSRGYTRLTPAYQRESPRYHEVWSAIEDPEILRLSADPDALAVSYTYRYTLPAGQQVTEEVTLRLVQRGGRLLIAGASARPL